MSKVTWRLVPFLMFCYFIAYLDRVNIGFAGATMSADLNLSATAFGGNRGDFLSRLFDSVVGLRASPGIEHQVAREGRHA
jgi:MFS transporter, ACS family, tartrate transporter